MTDATDINLNAQSDLAASDDSLPEDDQPRDDGLQIAQAESEAAEETEGEETAAEASSNAGAQPAPEIQSLAGETMVNRPPAGETVQIPVQPGERYVIDFDPTEAQVVIDGDDFVLVFADGGRLIFPSLVAMAESENSPVLQVGGVDIGGDVIIAQSRALSGEQPTLETAAGDTAAGPDAQGSGVNEYNDNLGDIIDTLVAQPDIPYVDRQFGLIDVEVIDPLELDDPIEEPFIPSLSALPSLGTVGEAFLPPRSPQGSQYDPAAGPQISSDPNAPAVGFEGLAVFDQDNGGIITEVTPVGGTPATPRAAGESETITYGDGSTITLTTVNDGDFLFFTPEGNLLLVNSVTGEYTYVLVDNELQPGVGQTGADDTIQEVFTFTVTDDFEQTATSTITVTIEDDAPEALDEAQLSVFENGSVIAPASVLENDTQGADGTDTVTSIGVTGDPADQQPIPAADGATIAGQFGSLTILQDGSYSYTANDLGDPPPANPVDTFVYTIVDEDGDSSQATISILVKESPVGGIAVAAGQTGDFIPEDIPTDVTLTAAVGNPPDPNDVLTEIVVDFGTPIDLDGSSLDTQWQLDPADLAAILALPEVTAVDLVDGGSVLTITLNGTTQSFTSDLTLTTPDDSDVDLDGVLVTVTAQDTVFGSTGSGTTSNDITADAIVDGSEVFRNGQVIDPTNDSLGTTTDTPVNLGLSLALGFDSTDLANGDAPVQGDTDGSDAGDVTEDVIQVTLQLDQGASLDLGLLTPQPTVTDLGGGVTLYTFDTAGLGEAAVNTLVSTFVVTPATGVTENITAVIETTTRELNTPPDSVNAPSGDEVNTADNVDIDTYRLTLKVVDTPGGELKVTGNPDGVIPEDVPTDTTLTASVGDPTNTDEVLTEIVVDFGTPIDLDGSAPETQWQLDPADLAAILALPEVTAVDLVDGTSVLTITLNGTTQTFSGVLTLTTPDDSDVDLDGVLVTVTSQDTSVGTTATGSSTSDITADAVVDGSEVFRNGQVITDTNDDVGTNVDTPVNLGLTLALGPDSTDQGNGDVSQGDEDGSPLGDDTEEVIEVTVLVDQGATLTFAGATAVETNPAAGQTLYSFDTSGLTEAQVNALVASFEVTPATGVTENITVTIETTTRELNTPPDSVNAPSGDEVVLGDNVDVDTYSLTVKVVDIPGGDLKVTGNPDGVIPEDVPTDTTLSASVGDPTNTDEVLTEIVVDFGTPIDLDGSSLDTQWQLDPADLAAILALPEVTAVDLADGTSVLTITLNGTTQTFSGVLTLTTPNDSDVDLDGVLVTVTAQDTSVGTTASGSSTSDITADAIVDGSEVFRNGQVITDANDDVGTNVDTPVNLGLSLALGFDSTDLANGDAPVQGDTDGSDAGDLTEDVIQVTLQLDQGASLDLGLLTPQPTVTDLGGGVTLYTFDTAGLGEAAVNTLVSTFVVTPATGVTENITAVIETTTRELNTPPDSVNAPSGDEVNTADNVDIDTYRLTLKVVDTPGGELKVTGNPDGVIPEDVPTDTTLTASVGDPTNTDEVLTEIVVDFGTPIDLDGSDPETQWQLDPADLAAILALPEVTAVDLVDGTSVLTITLNGTTQTFSGVLTLTTPDDSDVDLDGVLVTVTAQDTSVGTTASGSSTSDITADAVVDGSEVFRNGQVINNTNNTIGTNLNAAVLLGLGLELGPDSTDQDNGDVSQGDTDGSPLGDDTEQVTQVTVLVDQGATLTFAGAVAVEANPAPGQTLYSFDTSGLTEAQVNALVASFQVTPATDALEDINVTVETTTRELNTPPDSVNAPSGDEVVVADNTDVDSYLLVVKVVGIPGGDLKVTGNPDGVIPEDVPTDVTLTASVGDPTDTNEVLTEIVVDFGTAIDLDGSDPATQWQLDPADLAAILALPEVTAVDLLDGGSVLTITLNGTTQTFSGVLTLTTPDDSDVDLDGVQISVTAQDTSVGTTANGVSTSDIIADAVIDGSEITFGDPSGKQNQFAPIDLTTELVLGVDSTNSGNSTDPSQSDVADGSATPDDTEFVSKIEVTLTDEASGTPTGTLNFVSPLPSGITATVDTTNKVWTFEIADSASSSDVQALVDSFGVTPDFNYSGTINAQIETTMEELNTPPGNTNPASGDEVNVADNVDVDTYNVKVDVEPVQVNKAVEVSGGEPKPFNIVFVIDRSGSMDQSVQGGGATKFEVAEDAFRTLIENIRDQGIEVANVRLLGFNTGTLDTTDFTGLPTESQIDDFFDDLGSPNGGTRYEPPLTSASDFLNDINTSNPDVEYDNRILFLSDGGNNNSAGGFLLGTANGNNNAGSFDELSRLYGNVGDVGDDIPNLTIKSVGFGISKSFDGDGQSNIPGSTPVNAYIALDQSDDNMLNGSAIVSDANNGDDLAAAFGNIVDPALVEGTLFDGHTFVGAGQLNEISHFGRIYDATTAVDNADRDAAVAGDVVANTGSALTIKTENSGFLTVWFADEGGNLEGDFRYEGPPNFPGDRTDTVNYVVQDDVGLQLGQLDINISGQAPPNGDFENGNLVDWDFLGSVYLEENADLSTSNTGGDDFVAVLATNNANGLDPRDGGGNANREDEGVVDSTTTEDGNLTPVEDLGKDSNLQNLQLYTEADLETTLAANGDGTNGAADLSTLVADDILDGAVIQTSFQLDPLFGTPTGNQNLEISFDWNFATDEGAGGQNDIAFAVIEGQLFLLGSVGSSTFDGGAIDVGESEITYDRSTGWETATFSLGGDFQDVDGDGTIHIAFGVADAGTNVGENSTLLLDNVRADVS